MAPFLDAVRASGAALADDTLLHRKAWVVSSVFGPRREIGTAAWMMNKRAVDLVLSTFAIGEGHDAAR